ncbi:uncharacterized protein LOC135204137 [Macrobrachium nipponense]|uniref:uncharacterized protein LOC135204137 n=1 Tax=Macrobrachium nipponense TaxID=159736 RepID=UPI0030C7DF86
MKYALLLVLGLAVACMAQLPCVPSKPKNLRIGYVTAHDIEIEFEDPDDIDRCPVMGYHSEIEKVQETGRVLQKSSLTPSDQSHYHTFFFLSPNTLYKITVTAISKFDIASLPATIEAETLHS